MNYIMEEINPWASLYFVLFYAIMQMIVLNVISAVMVEVSNAISNDEAAAGKMLSTEKVSIRVCDHNTLHRHKFYFR